MDLKDKKNNYIILAENFQLQGNRLEALKKYEKSLEFTGDLETRILIMFRIALIKDSLGDYFDSIKIYDKILKMDKNQPGAYYGKAIAYEEVLEYDLALYNYKKAIDLNKYYDRAYFYLANLYDKMGDIYSALSNYLIVILLVDDYIAYNNIAGILEELGLNLSALSYVNKSIELEPSYYKSHYNRGVIRGRLGIFKEAILDYERAISLEAGFIYSYLNLSEIYLGQADYKKAVEITSQGLKLEKEADLYYNRACGHVFLKDYQKALLDLEKAIELDEEIIEFLKDDKDLDPLRGLEGFKKITNE